GFVNHVTVTALKWMRGEPLTQLVREAVKFKLSVAKKSTKSRPEQVIVDTAIGICSPLSSRQFASSLSNGRKHMSTCSNSLLSRRDIPKKCRWSMTFHLPWSLGFL